MNGVMNKTQFVMKRYSNKIKAERKQIHLKKVEKEWNKETTKQSKKRIEEDIRQEINKKRN